MHPQSIRRALPAISLLLSSCVSQQTQLVVPSPSPDRSPAAQQAAAHYIAAVAGQRQQVLFAASVNPDCSLSGEYSFDFVSRPLHGTVAFAPSRQFSAFAPENPRSICNDRRLQGMAVSYTSEFDFRGIDMFMLAIVSHSGSRRVAAFVMEVR